MSSFDVTHRHLTLCHTVTCMVCMIRQLLIWQVIGHNVIIIQLYDIISPSWGGVTASPSVDQLYEGLLIV